MPIHLRSATKTFEHQEIERITLYTLADLKTKYNKNMCANFKINKLVNIYREH